MSKPGRARAPRPKHTGPSAASDGRSTASGRTAGGHGRSMPDGKRPAQGDSAAVAERVAMLEEFVSAFDLWIVAGAEVQLPQFRLMTPEQQQLVRARQLTSKQYVTHVRRLLGGLPPQPTAIRPVILVQ